MAFLILFLEAFINALAFGLTLAIFVRVLLSWVPIKLPWGLGEFVWSVTEPILSPIRRALPFMGGIDFSPFIALIAIQVIESILLRILPPPL
ncbi:MAG TPA: YggT family protein [Candidatus Limnocylindrales bacterium]|nr:YggT family protein [Candidatus Limnocylindrales bacterium]